ncbi:MAG: hydroxyethylthiazole kinase [Salinivirgaceae bacterium]|nr:hydroxyethylthiazole kinase [Salinivirgaceae bacterium]
MDKNLVVKDLEAVRSQSPLVQSITNYVVMNNTANALLAIGASPIMAHAVEEMQEMATICQSLVINIGTLSPRWIEGMLLAGKTAKAAGHPVILDPVGAGATSYRTQTCFKIIEECQPDIIRGNGSEIMALVNSDIKSKGVDSSESSSSAVESAKILAKRYNCVVTISGEIDYATDGEQVIEIHGGSPMMAKVTGLGCTASALVGAFAVVNRNYLQAAASAMQVMAVAGELAAAKSRGTGSMQMNFLDELYNLSANDIIK